MARPVAGRSGMSENRRDPSRQFVEMLVEPLRVEGGFLVGKVWSTSKREAVPFRAELPANVSAETAMQGRVRGGWCCPAAPGGCDGRGDETGEGRPHARVGKPRWPRPAISTWKSAPRARGETPS